MAEYCESRSVDVDDEDCFMPVGNFYGDECSERDSDYETDSTDDEILSRSALNIQWTGYGRRIPVILFKVDAIHSNRIHFRTVAERYHMAFKFSTSDCKVIRKILLSHGFHETSSNSPEYNLMWSNTHLRPGILRFMTEFQKINHFPRSYELTRKDKLYKNIQRMQQTKGFKNFDIIPTSYIMPGDYQEFSSNFMKSKGIYIVKPVASSQGRGVFLVSNPEQVPFEENVIVSKYISPPLVIDGFKFDIRLYVSVTSYDPLVIYLYEEGLTRFATVKYEKDLRQIKNQCMHLTNYSINKTSQNYIKNHDPDVEDFGNKWSLGALLRYLRAEGRDTTALMMQIESVVIKTILSAEPFISAACKLHQPFRGNCFELYGFDILVDENLKAWVLEVNFAPSLACDSPLDFKVKSNMLCDLFSLVGIVCQDPGMKSRLQAMKHASDVPTRLGRRLASSSYSTVRSVSEENIPMAGLNSEEIKILRRVKEEESRKGGWIRIFPNSDSWDMYGPFLHAASSHNLMLHQRLFPERHLKGQSTNRISASISARPSLSRSKIHCPAGQFGKDFQERDVECFLRVRQYEKRLEQVRGFCQDKSSVKKSRSRLIQGLPEVEDICELESPEDCTREKDKDGTLEPAIELTELQPQPNYPKLHKVVNVKRRSSELCQTSLRTVEKVMNVCESNEGLAFIRPDQLSVSHSDVIRLLQSGQVISQIQARKVFAVYLRKVHERLLSDWNDTLPHGRRTIVSEQMELVLRFLKCAAPNLPQSVHIVSPSRKLSFADRKRLVAQQLDMFIRAYSKETEQMKDTKKRLKGDNGGFVDTNGHGHLNELLFENFVSKATEGDLETVLMLYAKNNNSTSVFLQKQTKVETSKEVCHKRKTAKSYYRSPTVSYHPVTFGVACDVGVLPAFDKHTREAPRTGSHQSSRRCYQSSPHLTSRGDTVSPKKLGRPYSASHCVVPDTDTYSKICVQDALQRMVLRHRKLKHCVKSADFLKAAADSLKTSDPLSSAEIICPKPPQKQQRVSETLPGFSATGNLNMKDETISKKMSELTSLNHLTDNHIGQYVTNIVVGPHNTGSFAGRRNADILVGRHNTGSFVRRKPRLVAVAGNGPKS